MTVQPTPAADCWAAHDVVFATMRCNAWPLAHTASAALSQAVRASTLSPIHRMPCHPTACCPPCLLPSRSLARLFVQFDHSRAWLVCRTVVCPLAGWAGAVSAALPQQRHAPHHSLRPQAGQHLIRRPAQCAKRPNVRCSCGGSGIGTALHRLAVNAASASRFGLFLLCGVNRAGLQACPT